MFSTEVEADGVLIGEEQNCVVVVVVHVVAGTKVIAMDDPIDDNDGIVIWSDLVGCNGAADIQGENDEEVAGGLRQLWDKKHLLIFVLWKWQPQFPQTAGLLFFLNLTKQCLQESESLFI